ncbi:MAG: RNA 2',3'-cyclic phosphodiesterase [Candidatus Omnitrophica bacterium]|nr:RNA 2',3'-cyclic phosphodiesterase [Candidatus Omnitrophota bacterium]
MRLFIAIDISDEIKAALASAQERLKASRADVKWIRPENMHLTLKFLGEVSEDKAPDIVQALETTAAGYSRFDISLFKLGAFPKLDFPRVIWAGIDTNCGLVEEIAGRIDEECAKLAFKKEARPFSAHLTIGRVGSLTNKDSLKELLLAITLPALNSVVREIVLYKSVLTPQGPVYTPVHKAPFK